MAELPVPRDTVISRLKNVEGQIRGIQKMVNDERECTDILIQLAAVRSGIEGVAVMVLKNYTHICITEQGRNPNADIVQALAMWVGSPSKS